jgi:GMP synthase-like glutamine amidotransferase
MAPDTILVVANSTDADSGYVGERFADRGCHLRTVMRDLGEVPTELPADVSALLLLGSEWSVHTPVEPDALRHECDLVRYAYGAGVPILGLCYGAQLVARALGGQVSAATEPEVGLVFVESDDEDLVPPGPWSAFHLDVLEAPPDARVIARNACGTQAFLLPGVLAVQFHPEVRPDTLADWFRRFPTLLEATGLRADELLERARAREPLARSAAHVLADAFLDRVAAASDAPPAPHRAT